MTKAELVQAVATKAGVTKAVAEKVITAQGEVVRATLQTIQGEVTLPEIGRLHVKRNEARKGRNPATGEAIDIPAKKVVKLKVAGALADAVA